METGRGDVGGHGRVADNVGRPSSNFFISVAEKKKADGEQPRSEI